MTGGMMFKGTPGPWSIHEKGDHPHPYVCGPTEITEYGEDKFVVAYVTGMGKKHNINLIAAAPELLEALQLFVHEYVELVDSGDAGYWNAEDEAKVIKARSAIAKALGEQK